MLLAIFGFLFGAGAVGGGYWALTSMPGMFERRRVEQRLFDLSTPIGSESDDETVLKHAAQGPLPAFDRVVSRTTAGSRLGRLIEQSGVRTTPGALMVLTLLAAVVGGLATDVFFRQFYLVPVFAGIAAALPAAFIVYRRGARMKKFEEQFPEALDLLSRALRAGHAFQTALGMVADELKEPVGPEFKKLFDQQNYGLPLRDSLNQMSERMPLIDVRFFVTAVLIQRETGGNLSEILDNLSHVVRERFKILRQVRVHTAHGRITGFVLLALPAFLAVAMTVLDPDHMKPLFEERVGQLMLVGSMVMQAIGFFWIRRVIKIEV